MIKQKLQVLGSFVFISLLILSLLRISLFLMYSHDFDTLSSGEVFLSFMMGIKIDAMSIFTFTSLIIIAMFLPFRFTSSKLYNQTLGYFWYLILIVIIFVVMADIVYFEFVQRHIGNEITAIGNDTHVITDMIIEYKFLFLVYIVLSILLFLIFKRIIAIDIEVGSSSLMKRLGLFILIFILLIVAVRGKIQGKPFSVSDAFVVNKTASGNLALNGFYTLYRTVGKTQKVYTYYPYKEALNITQKLLNTEKSRFDNPIFPLERINNDTQNVTKHNVVIILLESWSSKFVDSYGNNNLGVTPNFDKLAQNGVKFTNFYANGQRSIEGITALFTGIPVLKGFNYLGKGLELSNVSYIGDLAKQNGYTTLAMQSSKRGSFRVDALTKIAGFDEYYGSEDMPLVGKEDKDKKPKFGTWDGNMYQLLSKKLSVQKEPFLSFAFTSTTHTPFISPGKKWEQFEHNNKNVLGYLNTLKYADDMLGEFMQRSSKEPWFDNTIFIFMADHTIGFGDDSEMFRGTDIKIKNRVLEEMRIPLLVYAPKILKGQENTNIGSQVNIIATLMDILNWKGSFSTIANSMFEEKNQFAVFSSGQTIGMIDQSGYIKHTLEKKLELTGDESLEKKILSYYQIIGKLLRENKWSEN